MASKPDSLHILMLPFMAQGHIRPFLELAHLLHSRTPHITITLLTTPLNASLLSSTTSNLHVSSLPFHSPDHDLPAGVENTDRLPITHIISLFHASASLEPHLRNFIATHFAPSKPPTCIIFDPFLGWAAAVARDVGSPGVAFTTCGAYGTAAYMALWLDLPHRNLPDDKEFTLPGFPENHRYRRAELHRFLRFADGSDPWSMFFQPQIRLAMGCSGWLCNSVEELEPLGFRILREYLKKPVWAVRQMVPPPKDKSNPTLSSSSSSDESIQWLNSQRPDSVLYISFGSQNTISPTQMMDLAMGLELSCKPFLWVIRPPSGFDINGEFRPEWLPDGFEDRMGRTGQGKLVHKWGPQLDILAHVSTGGFLSHCGWNSCLEGLSSGLPMLTWPLAAEQAYNSKMLVLEMGVAVELAVGLEGEVGKEKVKRAVELVLGREEGSEGLEMKRKAVESGRRMKEAGEEEDGCKGSTIRAVDDFVEALVSGRVGKEKMVEGD